MSETAIAKPEDIIEADFLTVAIQEVQLASSDDLPEEFLMTDEEMEEVDDVFAPLRILRFSGSKGRFGMVGEEEDRREEIQGAILSRLEPDQAWFGADDEKADGTWPADTWICRSWSREDPPILNSELTPLQRDRALSLGAGQDCRICPLAQWNEDVPPTCKQSVRCVWFDAENREAVILQGPVTSSSRLEDYVKHCKREGKRDAKGRKRPAALMSFALKVTSVEVKKGSRCWEEMVFQPGQRIPAEVFRALRQLREDAMDDITAARKRASERAALVGGLGEQPALPAPSQASPPPPALADDTPAPAQAADDFPWDNLPDVDDGDLPF